MAGFITGLLKGFIYSISAILNGIASFGNALIASHQATLGIMPLI